MNKILVTIDSPAEKALDQLVRGKAAHWLPPGLDFLGEFEETFHRFTKATLGGQPVTVTVTPYDGEFEPGHIVHHSKLGIGTVKDIHIIVDYEQHGEKKMSLKYVGKLLRKAI